MALVQRLEDFIGKISKDQLLAQARRPIATARVGRRAKQLSRSSKPWILYDLDETLTYNSPMKHAALPAAFKATPIGTPTIRSWTPYQRTLQHDIPEPEMAALFRSHKETHNVGILTARSERARGITQRWLQANNLTPDLLMMRPLSRTMENMGSGPYKQAMIRRYLPQARIEHMYDDSGSVISAMEEMGIPATKVIPKNAPISQPANPPSSVSNRVVRQAARLRMSRVPRHGETI